MRCSRIRTVKTPTTNPFPIIGFRKMGSKRKEDGGRKAMIVPRRVGIPMVKIFCTEKSFFE